ncbi:uncharacterized protein VTP21DRAFT_4092 [Calcarisporiella thermophila]|uniref:uncharacterized protein n=1 Tax=Calcarisporiella thermophila TaxID=911321 RepID=UPI003743F3E7
MPSIYNDLSSLPCPAGIASANLVLPAKQTNINTPHLNHQTTSSLHSFEGFGNGGQQPNLITRTMPTLQNLVATLNLQTSLDLKAIALYARNAEYNPKRFAAVIMRIRDPKTTALIFTSGKMVVTGAKSEEDSRLAARKFVRIIQKLGFDAKFMDFKIQNIVATTDAQFQIRLEEFALTHGQYCSYEPELFPGLVYRMMNPKVVLLIFVSGKVVLTGAKLREDIYTAFQRIFPVLQEFRKL